MLCGGVSGVSGEPVVLTVHGCPTADITPHRTRRERRPSEQLAADLAEISVLADELHVDRARLRCTLRVHDA
jgi:antitoxin (DNA-binding transcriptional repressor) of toxin-antitoxin stability system